MWWALLVTASVCCAQTKDAATDLTVRLFTVHPVEMMRVSPAGGGAMVRRCASCVAESLKDSVTVKAVGGTLLVDGKATAVLQVDGTIRVEVAGEAPAMAAGKWRVGAVRDGLRVLLTLPSERYVMDVLASEAAVDEPEESLKALAIVVRSFALTNLRRHAAEGYNFCDSTHCQAMRLGAVPLKVEEAVRATAGETLWFGEARVPGYFTQHCGGMTEDASALWGGPRLPWLVAHADAFCQKTPSQWHAEMSGDALRGALAEEGWPLRETIENVRVVQHTSSGRVRLVEISAGGRRLQLPASTFRFAVNRTMGWDELRSDWYSVRYAQGRVTFDGRGYGHGVGLCQAGAHAMAAQGKDARAILRFYFPGAVVRIGATDDGWIRRDGSGWTLFTAGGEVQSVELLRVGDGALRRAKDLFVPRGEVHPQVRAYPTTELFREGVGEPGWVLASTKGETVSLQPPGVVERHERVEEALLHEFLHVLIEKECRADTPLWLREGMVEFLTGGDGRREVGVMRVQTIEDALLRASSPPEAQRAHEAAGAMVRRLVQSRGMTTVRGWLRGGVPAEIAAGSGAR